MVWTFRRPLTILGRMEYLFNTDHWLFHMINSTLSHPWLDQFFPAITDLHKTLPFQILVPFIIFTGLFRFYGAKAFVIFIGCLLCLGIADGFSSQALKDTIQRPRPFQVAELHAIQRSPAGGYSFPSNHALNMFALAVYLSAFLPIFSPLLFLIAVLVAYSRVYNGVHFPSDVVAGALLGSLFGYVFAKTFQWSLRTWKKRNS